MVTGQLPPVSWVRVRVRVSVRIKVRVPNSNSNRMHVSGGKYSKPYRIYSPING